MEKKSATPKLGKLVDPHTGGMECRVCGAYWVANLRSGGHFRRGSWQCPYGCTPEDLQEMKTAQQQNRTTA
jgi:hypothetical protein